MLTSHFTSCKFCSLQEFSCSFFVHLSHVCFFLENNTEFALHPLESLSGFRVSSCTHDKLVTAKEVEITLSHFWDASKILLRPETTRYCSMTWLWALRPNTYRGMEHPCSAPHSELFKVLWVWTEWGMWTLTQSFTSCKKESSLKFGLEREHGFEEHCWIIRGKHDTFWLL